MKKITFPLLCAFLIYGSFAQAANDTMSVSLIAGSASATSNGSGSWSATGASFEYMLNSSWGLGMEYDSINSVGFLSAEVNYFFTPEWYAGLQLGSAQSGPSNSLVGPQFGYDYRFANSWSVGPELEYLSSTTSGATSFFVALVNLKLFF